MRGDLFNPRLKPAFVLEDVTSKNELTAEQRLALLRRVRVLEKRLGEPLREDETGKWIVESSTGIEYEGQMFSGCHKRSQSSLQRIKAAFGLDKDEAEVNSDIIKRPPPSLPKVDASSPQSLSPPSVFEQEHEEEDEDASMRIQRRRQLAKVGRL